MKGVVSLFSPSLCEYRDFGIKQAETVLKGAQKRLEKNPNQVTWELPESSKYKFVNGKLITGADKGTNKKPQK